MKTSNRTRIGWLGHVLTALAVIIFLVGCVIIGYVAWILSTSVSIQKFQSGTLVLTYIVIGIGLTLFFTGLIGWVAGSSETAWSIRLYIVMVVVSITAAIGGVLALQITRIELQDILRFAWMESNQSIRNFIQSSVYLSIQQLKLMPHANLLCRLWVKILNCCGFKGPREFAGNNYHMDQSCYEIYQGEKRLKLASCSSELSRWFENNKSIWVSIVVALVFVQILSVVIAAISLHFLAKNGKTGRNDSRSSSNRRLYEDSDNTSETFRDSL